MVSQGRDRGVADSQFNLGILYARGIGVEQNLAESFKWFSLAAAQGDADAVRKRDDIAKRSIPSRSRRQSSRSRPSRQNPSPTTPSTWRARRADGTQRRRRPVRQSPQPSRFCPSEPPLRIDAVGGVAVIYPIHKNRIDKRVIKPCRRLLPEGRLRDGFNCREDHLSFDDRQDARGQFRRSPTGPRVTPPRKPTDQACGAAASCTAAGGICGRPSSSYS